MKYAFTYKALKVFSWLFLFLGLCALLVGVGGAIFAHNEVQEPGMELAAMRLAKFGYFAYGLSYGLTFLFFGLITRALGLLIGEVKASTEKAIVTVER